MPPPITTGNSTTNSSTRFPLDVNPAVARRSDRARYSPGPARGPIDVFTRVAATGTDATISPSRIPPAPWTFFTYVAADNNLAQYAAMDLQEMTRVGSSPSMNVLALVDAPGGAQLCFVEKGRTRRIDVDPFSALGRMLANGVVNSGDPALLRAAVEYVQREVPSSKFFLNLWNHGDAWRAFADDQSQRDYIDIAGGELVDALRGLPVDVLGADACTMATAEIASIARALGAKVLVASVENEPGTGWNYGDVLERVQRVLQRGGNELDVSKSVVDSYATGPADNTTLSATDLTKFDSVRDAINKLSQTLVQAGGLQNVDIRRVYMSVPRVDRDSPADMSEMDLRMFALALWNAFEVGPIRDAARALVDTLATTTTDGGRARQRGTLSIYAPLSKVLAEYEGPRAAWSELRWGTFLRTLQGSSVIGAQTPTWAVAAPTPAITTTDELDAFKRSSYSKEDAKRALTSFPFLHTQDDAERYIGLKILNGMTDILDAEGITPDPFDNHELEAAFRDRGFGDVEVEKAKRVLSWLSNVPTIDVVHYIGMKIIAGDQATLALITR